MQLSSIWSDGMIIQRGKLILLKGYARGNKVTVTFAGEVYQAAVEDNQCFEIQIPSMEAGGPYEIILYDGERSVISDVMIGDVWVLGGQSNMELPISRTMDVSGNDVKDAYNPEIRMFQVPKEYSFEGPRSTLKGGTWREVNKKNIMEFSAVGYFLAIQLYQKYQVPIGLIHAAIGGTPIEAWMSEETLHQIGEYETVLLRNKDSQRVSRIIEEDNNRITKWHVTMDSQDAGLQENKWFEENYNDKKYQNIVIPGMWKNTFLDGYKGSVWFRKEFMVPDEWLDQEVLLRLGAIIDGDETYVNGVLVGHTDYRYPPRKYLLPPNLLHKGMNQITLRVFSDAQPGGFMPGKKYGLELKEEVVSLEGLWNYKIGAPMKPLEIQTFFQYEPAGVFNGMISPLRDLGICGVTFYQGESNTKNPKGYADKFEHMIQDWRQVFNQGNIPFLYVQLANFTDGETEKLDENWELLRQEQEKVLRVANTAMVDAFDIGEYNDLHPQNKKELGRRLFVAARRLVFKEEVLEEANIKF
ncbi:MAG: sialate O-acetylesterase [Lachnotalea sp.]